jgi:hypothetical protein
MFTEYHVIQFILHCLIANIKDRSAETTVRAVSFGTEDGQSTKYFYYSLQLTTLIITLTHITIYYYHD